jgi:VWFA-related protein
MRAASLLVVAVVALLTPAYAASVPKVGTVDTSSYPTLRFSVVTQTPSPRAPVVRENGEPVVGLEAENLARAKNVVLAVDRSRSMAGAALANAVTAARSFLASKPPADRVAVIGFGRQAVRLTGFSSSTTDVDAALAALAVDDRQGTALYDAVSLGARVLGAESLPGRVLIVLTDGDDVSSATSLTKAAAEARQAGVAVYAIGIEGEGFSPGALQQLADVTGGAYFPVASSAAVDSAYASIADRLRRTWRVTYVTAAAPGGSVRVRTSVNGDTATLAARMPGDSSYVVSTGKPSFVPAFLYEHNVGTVALSLATGSLTIFVVGLLLATPGGTRLRRTPPRRESAVDAPPRASASPRPQDS